MRIYLIMLLAAPGLVLAEQQCFNQVPSNQSNRFTTSQELITDNLTGLIWQRCTIGSVWAESLSACNNDVRFNWQDTLKAVDTFNEEQRTNNADADWRLPNIKELASLVTLHCINPATDLNAFPQASGTYWSSTPATGQAIVSTVNNGYTITSQIWSVNFNNGRTVPESAINSRSARLVRGGNP